MPDKPPQKPPGENDADVPASGPTWPPRHQCEAMDEASIGGRRAMISDQSCWSSGMLVTLPAAAVFFRPSRCGTDPQNIATSAHLLARTLGRICWLA